MQKKIVIIGAGPAGLLLARLLADSDEHAEIHVFERALNPHQRRNTKSFSFAVFERGFKALSAVPGLGEKVRQQCTTVRKRSLNSLPEESRRSNVPFPFTLCERDDLIRLLVESIEELDSQRVHLHFGQICTKVELAKREVQFEDQAGAAQNVAYDLLLAADGANSIVRRTLEAEQGYACEDKPYAVAYRNFYLSPQGVQKLKIGPDELHAWMLPERKMVGAVPQPDGTATCNLLFPIESSKADLAEFHWGLLEQHCPELMAVIEEEERLAFLSRPVMKCRTIKMDCYHFEDHICLLGDAAHAVPPSIGQGCNSAMEDSAVLVGLLDQFKNNQAAALKAFTTERVPEMHALLTLSTQPAQADAKLGPAKDRAAGDSPEKPRFSIVDYLAKSTEPFSKVLKEKDALMAAAASALIPTSVTSEAEV